LGLQQPPPHELDVANDTKPSRATLAQMLEGFQYSSARQERAPRKAAPNPAGSMLYGLPEAKGGMHRAPASDRTQLLPLYPPSASSTFLKCERGTPLSGKNVSELGLVKRPVPDCPMALGQCSGHGTRSPAETPRPDTAMLHQRIPLGLDPDRSGGRAYFLKSPHMV
jgi:hypothetical protein